MTTMETKERRSRRDLKELAKLAAEMPRTPPGGVWSVAAPAPSAPLNDVARAKMPARFAVPPAALSMPAPVIREMHPDPAPLPAPPAPRRSALMGAIIGASVGLVISAIGIAAVLAAGK